MMYDGYSLMENKLELRFMGADEKIFSEQTFFEGERMPFELFFLVRKGTLLFMADGNRLVVHKNFFLSVNDFDPVFR